MSVRAFSTALLRSLVKRGLTGVQLALSDAHEGLKQAIRPGKAITLYRERGYSAHRRGDMHRRGVQLSLLFVCSIALLVPVGAQVQGSPTPRWPDGQPRLGPPPGEQGYWGAASATSLIEKTAARLDVSADGLLANPGDADRVAPLQPWARALYLQRQRARLASDPAARCMPPGGPRQFQTPHGFQFVEQRELGRILVLLGGGNRNWRVIHTDGRPPVQAAEAVLGYYGTSVGRWEQDTLIVESVGFNERFWLARGGLPHTEALRLVERFTRTDLRTLNYEVTIDDPGAYTRPWTAGWTIEWIPDRQIQEYFCEGDAP